MDRLTQMIVDILRRGKETEALNSGGVTAGTMPPAPPPRAPMAPAGAGPRGMAPKHDGKTYEQIVAEMGG